MRLLAWVFLLLLAVGLFPGQAGAGVLLNRTFHLLEQLPGANKDQLDKNRPRIEKLEYSNLRILAALCSIPGISAPEAISSLAELEGKDISYDGTGLFEKFCKLDGITLKTALAALEIIRDLDFTSIWAATDLCNIRGMNAKGVLVNLPVVSRLSDPARWAAKSYFEIKGQSSETVTRGLEAISRLPKSLCWPVEASNKIKGITVSEALRNIEAIENIHEDDSWVIRSMFGLDDMTSSKAYSWLTGFFAQPLEKHDEDYLLLPPAEKMTFLKAYHNASDFVIRDINNLHSLTHPDGEEIADEQLNQYSFAALHELFERLSAEVREIYKTQFGKLVKKGDKKGTIDLLRGATARARKEKARRQSAAQLYILLSRAPLLYDSSYRLVLVPELQSRLAKSHQGSLLRFIRDIDPENTYVANFVSSLSQKGRLTNFLPGDAHGQQEILQLVATSAFRDENSLVLFAATFEKLLQSVLPQARSFIIGNMISQSRGDTLFAKQIRVILQYYEERQPELLGKASVAEIQKVMAEYETVSLEQYLVTPFAEWIGDGMLSGLSVFHDDDDGRNSFVSNCRYLMKNDYLPRVNSSFIDNRNDEDLTRQLAEKLSAVVADKPQSLGALFDFLKTKPVGVDFVRSFDSLQLSHSFFVFQNKEMQQRLVERFISGGHEMFSHRGHSYWLEEHILNPLHELLQSGRLKREEMAAKKRFISIGACGGINIYNELTQTFCNKIDLLGSIGAGKTVVNNMYNRFLFETIAQGPIDMNWNEVDKRSLFIFRNDPEKDYQLPGGLPAILYKVIGEGRCWF